MFKAAPNPNAARLFQNWLFSPKAQQLWSIWPASIPSHALVKEKPARRKLAEIKLMKDDPAGGVEKASEEIKTRYAQIFRV